MAIPDLIPIAYEANYRTDLIGTFDNGQFFGSVTATLQPGAGDGWFRFKRWYAVLHKFSTDGAHTGSQIWFGGTSEDEATSVNRAEARLAGWLDALPGRVHGDIAIKLFHTETDGHIFGLIDGSEEYDGQDHAELVPDNLGFDPPWDGCYDT